MQESPIWVESCLHGESEMTVLFSATSEAEDADSAMWSQAHWPPLKIKQLQPEKVNDRLSGLACCQSFGQSGGWNETLWGRHHQAAPLGQQWPPPQGGACFHESCLGFPFSFLLPGPFVSEQTSVPLFPCLKRVWEVLHPWWLRAIHASGCMRLRKMYVHPEFPASFTSNGESCWC